MSWAHFLPTFGALFVIVMVRANATYWIGRGAVAGSRRLRSSEGGPSPAWQRAQKLVHRWGPVAVVFCFLTVGIQTAVNATAGISRMPLRRYLPAVTLGSMLWATIYATVGLAAAQAWVAAAAGSPGVATAVAVALVVAVLGILWYRRSRAGRADRGVPADSEDQTGEGIGPGDVMSSASDVRS